MKKYNEHDPRFQVAKKEAWIGIIFVIINFLWWYGFAYGFGSQPVEEYQFIFGFPSWFFWSCIVGFIFMVALVTTVVKVFFKDIPLDGDGEKQP